MFSQIPINFNRNNKDDIDKEILRSAMIAELDAINLYEEMAALTDEENLRKILLNVANEEKIHVAMFQTVLMEIDNDYLKVMAK
ncbi:MAG: rubrerythrin, partial [Methanomethylovorans sp.]|nr:rubrerythrin [Methanomethylovorans sp.]